MSGVKLKDLLLKQKLKGIERRSLSAAKRAGKDRASAKRIARSDMHESLRRDIVGLELTWDDYNPMGDDGCSGLPTAVSHNPCQLTREGVIAAFRDPDYRAWMIEQEFTWLVDIELWYRLPNSKTKSHRIDPVYFTQRGSMKDKEGDLSAINVRIEKDILLSRMLNEQRPDGDKNKGVFEVAKYKITCIGV